MKEGENGAEFVASGGSIWRENSIRLHYVSNHTRYELDIRVKKLDLESSAYYSVRAQKEVVSLRIHSTEGLPLMKLAVRIFALSIVFVGVAAASVSKSTPHAIPSHQSATASNPIPLCAPGLPGCPDVP